MTANNTIRPTSDMIAMEIDFLYFSSPLIAFDRFDFNRRASVSLDSSTLVVLPVVAPLIPDFRRCLNNLMTSMRSMERRQHVLAPISMASSKLNGQFFVDCVDLWRSTPIDLIFHSFVDAIGDSSDDLLTMMQSNPAVDCSTGGVINVFVWREYVNETMPTFVWTTFSPTKHDSHVRFVSDEPFCKLTKIKREN